MFRTFGVRDVYILDGGMPKWKAEGRSIIYITHRLGEVFEICDTVSVLLANTPAMLECHYGVPMTGAVLNTLNTRLDAATIAFSLDHAEARVLIVDKEFSKLARDALPLMKGPHPIVIDYVDPEFVVEGERLGAFRTDFDRDLVGRTANAAAAHLDLRLHVVQRIVEQLDRVRLGPRFHGFHRTVNDAFSNRLLTIEHEVVHELRQDLIPELGIGQDFPLLGTTTT